ncbi:MAG: N-acetyl-gamma-glutamyl-phosphate reductase [Desulfovibrio sp.]|nr:N-acetyl-gamma-glutamyl-phosphate reductase [Desulfovibrio sp.]
MAAEQEKKFTVGLVGVTGYTGMELARLLSVHPALRLVRVTSRKEEKRKLGDLHPFLRGFDCGELPVSSPDPEDLASACELVFLAVPHGAAMTLGAELLRRGCKVVDLSADFRLREASVYETWYGTGHNAQELLAEAVYGLPELYGPRIAAARLTANPGCYPTASILGLYPALQRKLVEEDGLIIDAKSGVSGAGRELKPGSLFCEVCESFKAYSPVVHRHTPEIEQELSFVAGKKLAVTFTPHLLPANRGILATIYATLKDKNLTLGQALEVYADAYAGHPFVRVLPAGELPELRNVRGTMFCDIGVVVDQRAGRLLLVACIDNLCRGASGQAVANANLMLGLDLRAGLLTPALTP